MRATHLAALFALLAPVALAACGDKAATTRGPGEIPDDQFVPPAPPPAQQPVSQAVSASMSFRAKHSAPLTAVEVYVARLQGSGTNDITVTLNRALPSGMPDPNGVLGTATFSSSAAGANFDFLRVPFPGSGIPITMGQSYAIVLRVTGPASIKWGAGAGDAYSDGAASVSDSAGAWSAAVPPVLDLGFRSLITTGG